MVNEFAAELIRANHISDLDGQSLLDVVPTVIRRMPTERGEAAQVPKGCNRDVTRALSEAAYVGTKGGEGPHEKWVKAEALTIVVPRHLDDKRFARRLLKQAGVDAKLRFRTGRATRTT